MGLLRILRHFAQTVIALKNFPGDSKCSPGLWARPWIDIEGDPTATLAVIGGAAVTVAHAVCSA